VTPFRLEIVKRGRHILNERKDLVEAARAGSEPLSGTLRMGVIATVGPFLLPEVLPALHRSYPALRLYLVEDLTARLVEKLRAAGVCIIGYPAWVSRIVAIMLSFVVVIASFDVTHALASADRVRMLVVRRPARVYITGRCCPPGKSLAGQRPHPAIGCQSGPHRVRSWRP